MSSKKTTRASWSTKRNVMWNKKMILILCQAWESKSPQEIADMVSTSTVKVEAKSVTHMVNVLRAKGVDIPKKHKVGVYQVLVDDFLTEHPEFKKKGGK